MRTVPVPAKALASALCLLVAGSGAWAGAKKVQQTGAADNPPAYAAFSKPLSAEEKVRHALDRLTFGPRPGDVEAVERSAWTDGSSSSFILTGCRRILSWQAASRRLKPFA